MIFSIGSLFPIRLLGNNARQPFGNIATSANTYGLVTSYEFTPQFIVSGWGGFTNAQSETGASQNAGNALKVRMIETPSRQQFNQLTAMQKDASICP
jgi:hypothetical protein